MTLEIVNKIIRLPIKEIVIENRYRKKMGDIEALARNINEHILLVIITVKFEPIIGKYILVDGQRRILAVQLLGWTEIDCYVINLEDNIMVNVMQIPSGKNLPYPKL